MPSMRVGRFVFRSIVCNRMQWGTGMLYGDRMPRMRFVMASAF